ncbi:hypothetical protein ACOSQ4_016538 [Xanthoceras sorbifolium]
MCSVAAVNSRFLTGVNWNHHRNGGGDESEYSVSWWVPNHHNRHSEQQPPIRESHPSKTQHNTGDPLSPTVPAL